jgi:hypothetical protein
LSHIQGITDSKKDATQINDCAGRGKEVVVFIKAGPLNSHTFNALCEAMGSAYE